MADDIQAFDPWTAIGPDRSRGLADAAISPGGPHEDRVYASWHHDADGIRRLLLAHSDDLGQSWSNARQVREVPGRREAYFQRIDTDGQGRSPSLAAAWMRRAGEL